MKNYLFILMLVPTLSVVDFEASMANISKAIRSGDVETLSSYFDDNIEIAVLDNEDVYDRTQAKKLMEDFFQKNQPKSFQSVHEGTSKGKDSQYLIGNLSAGTSTYRVYIYMNIESDKALIQELRFDEE